MSIDSSIGDPEISVSQYSDNHSTDSQYRQTDRMESRERTAFGQRMYLARKRAGLTQKQVADRLGELGQSAVAGVERTAHATPRVVEYAKLYGVDPMWLARGDGKGPDDSASILAADQIASYTVTRRPATIGETANLLAQALRDLPAARRANLKVCFEALLERGPDPDQRSLVDAIAGARHVPSFSVPDDAAWLAAAESLARLEPEPETREIVQRFTADVAKFLRELGAEQLAERAAKSLTTAQK